MVINTKRPNSESSVNTAFDFFLYLLGGTTVLSVGEFSDIYEAKKYVITIKERCDSMNPLSELLFR